MFYVKQKSNKTFSTISSSQQFEGNSRRPDRHFINPHLSYS